MIFVNGYENFNFFYDDLRTFENTFIIKSRYQHGIRFKKQILKLFCVYIKCVKGENLFLFYGSQSYLAFITILHL